MTDTKKEDLDKLIRGSGYSLAMIDIYEAIFDLPSEQKLQVLTYIKDKRKQRERDNEIF